MNRKIITERERFRMLTEYTFINDDSQGSDTDDLLLDDMLSEDDTEISDDLPSGNEEDIDFDDSNTSTSPEEETDDVDLSGEIPTDEVEPAVEPLVGDQPAAPAPEEVGDEIELDVTELVQGTKDAKNSADMANQQVAQLVAKFDSLKASLDNMNVISNKIDSLEKEIERRNPTEVEKLEMRSFNSYPYNLKLTDYWADKKGAYDVMNVNNDDDETETEPEELVLTTNDIESDYNPNEIKNSFDYDEEEVDEIY
jgi:hypothetical protein